VWRRVGWRRRGLGLSLGCLRGWDEKAQVIDW
jgi:hypothetical protein